MPIYVYRCDDCAYVHEDFVHNMKPPAPPKCPRCVKPMRRAYGTTFDAMNVERPRYSESMGCMPEQIPQMMKQFPGSQYDAKGRLLIKSRAHKLHEMKRRGCVERD